MAVVRRTILAAGDIASAHFVEIPDMTASEEPVYVTKPSWRTLWQTYRVFPDRVELSSFTGTKIVPFDQIDDIAVRPPLTIDLFKTGFPNCWALKLDFVDFFRHVAIKRKAGFIKRLRFTPDDPETFVDVVEGLRREA